MHFLREIVYVKKIQFKYSTIVFASEENQGIENFREVNNLKKIVKPFFSFLLQFCKV